MIIPSIDILDGKVVQLKQGKEKVYENRDIERVVNQYKIFPQINVIDLNAAMGNGSNKQLIKELCQKLDCNIGGGIREQKLAKEYLDAGANSVIIGTRANKEFLGKLPKDKVIVALDTKDRKNCNAWMETVKRRKYL